MAFTLLPAVDVSEGRSVRLVHGELGTASDAGDAGEIAHGWQAGGADWIHLVDIDAAFGLGSNATVLAELIGELDVDVQLSGGICDDASLNQALSTGCARVVIATQALEDLPWCARAIATHGARVAIALDVRVAEQSDGSRQHVLAARGWTRDGGELWETLTMLDRAGCSRYIVTDVSKDGALQGPNLGLYRSVTRATPASVIASGGIATLADLIALAEHATTAPNMEGAVVGSALHTRRFTLPQALDAVRAVSP